LKFCALRHLKSVVEEWAGTALVPIMLFGQVRVRV
jgi:hypothetical protein